jgi:hypothetical protein
MTPTWPRQDKYPNVPPGEPVPGDGQGIKKSLPPVPKPKDDKK